MFTLFPSAENKKLEKLNLSWNNIRGKGAVSIFKGIKVAIYILTVRYLI
jgi:hypothetical protein